MPIQIVPHERRHSPSVEAFNQRMRAGGSPWGFYVDPDPHWIPRQPGTQVWREYHLAVEDDGVVRGAYALKPQDWWVRGAVHVITDWQGPFSEGSVDPRFNTLGLRMMRDMLKKRPALYSWGHGGNEQPVVQMLQKMGWTMHETDFALLVVHAGRFLRLNRLLRNTALRYWTLGVGLWDNDEGYQRPSATPQGPPPALIVAVTCIAAMSTKLTESLAPLATIARAPSGVMARCQGRSPTLT